MPRDNRGGGRNNASRNSSDKKEFNRFFVDGIMVFTPREGAPKFVIADICINIDELTDALNNHEMIDSSTEKIYGQIMKKKDEDKFYLQFNSPKK